MKRKFPTHVSESKNNTHVKKVGHTSEFPFDIYCWTSKKPDYLLKKVLKWVNKKYKNFNIYMLYLKTKEKHLEISLFCECDRLEFVIMGHFLSFYTPSLKTPKIVGDIIILHMCAKNHNHMSMVLESLRVRQNFLSLWAIFFLLFP